MRSRLASLEPPAPCARCERRVAGVKWGDLCPDCLAELKRRASPLARVISLVFVAVVIGYAWLRIPLTPMSRLWVAAVAVATYFLVRKIATQIAVELMRK
ncbi:MAG TPA: hypothetical protein VJK71_00130 [Gemmatimonadales bacterium]|nr:hypothetical protein [Gemmatimonadales bacterium]